MFPSMAETWRTRLRDEIARQHTSMKRLSLDAKLGETFVRDILERGRDPSRANANKIALALKVPLASIFGEDGLFGDQAQPSSEIIEADGGDMVRVPVYEIRFAAGAGAHNEDSNPIDHYSMSATMLRAMTNAPLDKIAVFQVDGDSMEPTIQDRGLVIVDLSRTRLTTPGIYALVHEGEGLLKRASQHFQTGAVTLVSDNPAYPPQTIDKPHNLTVIGRVFGAISRH